VASERSKRFMAVRRCSLAWMWAAPRSEAATRGEVITAEEEARRSVMVMAPVLATRLTDVRRRRLGARLMAGDVVAQLADSDSIKQSGGT
jgi:hypothetical protein